MKLLTTACVRSILKNPYKIFIGLVHHGFFTRMEDERYLKLLYHGVLGRALHLKPPVLYSEKIQWLKLHDKNPVYPVLCDKIAVRDFVRERIGEEYLVELFGAWDDPEKIDFSALPEKFVLKCTHDSGSAILCEDKKTLDIPSAKRALKKRLMMDYSIPGREWPYHNVPRRILAERYLTGCDGSQAMEFKFFCFDGKPRLVLVCTNHTRHSGNYTYRMDFTQFQIYDPFDPQPEDPHIPRPLHYEKMIEIAERLSEGFVHMRVDLYDTSEGVKFGELTLHSSSGLSQTMNERGERFLGGLLRLKNVK